MHVVCVIQCTDAGKEAFINGIGKHYATLLNKQLEGKDYLIGSQVHVCVSLLLSLTACISAHTAYAPDVARASWLGRVRCVQFTVADASLFSLLDGFGRLTDLKTYPNLDGTTVCFEVY